MKGQIGNSEICKNNGGDVSQQWQKQATWQLRYQILHHHSTFYSLKNFIFDQN